MGLDPNSCFPPEGTDVAAAIERLALEAQQLESARAAQKKQGQLLEAPLKEKSVSELSHAQRLVALLLTCGASTLDIALELNTTAQEIESFEGNLLIGQQMELYKERFFSSDANSRLKGMLPPGLKFLSDVIENGSAVDPEKRLDTVKWLIEKLTGKPAQQIDLNQNMNFGNLLDEMKKMREAQAALPQSANTEVIDVTPRAKLPAPKNDYKKWLSDFKRRKEQQP